MSSDDKAPMSGRPGAPEWPSRRTFLRVGGPEGRLISIAMPTSAEKAEAIHQARRARAAVFGRPDLFGEPAWDLLLELFAAHHKGRQVSISSACIAAAVPATTALRWIDRLEHLGLLQRTRDKSDGRRSYISLAPATLDLMEGWLADWT